MLRRERNNVPSLITGHVRLGEICMKVTGFLTHRIVTQCHHFRAVLDKETRFSTFLQDDTEKQASDRPCTNLSPRLLVQSPLWAEFNPTMLTSPYWHSSHFPQRWAESRVLCMNYAGWDTTEHWNTSAIIIETIEKTILAGSIIRLQVGESDPLFLFSLLPASGTCRPQQPLYLLCTLVSILGNQLAFCLGCGV